MNPQSDPVLKISMPRDDHCHREPYVGKHPSGSSSCFTSKSCGGRQAQCCDSWRRSAAKLPPIAAFKADHRQLPYRVVRHGEDQSEGLAITVDSYKCHPLCPPELGRRYSHGLVSWTTDEICEACPNQEAQGLLVNGVEKIHQLGRYRDTQSCRTLVAVSESRSSSSP
ncbi:hypothetical protein MAPG_06059 [Magnaporthiopsis poae ATCC 64411]|uniref:Uncharacterized protein n=1 Tax=Magnaporthiopsis poae (strain ATCC 64411 / 73-15) TaxID=644358 RepID=A0A0C4E116_MAGP6|nr:hypothetical protein MAPG_06059 [Magnaporthiopsis poae ATCC 64411]